jgi:hypothetical protein
MILDDVLSSQTLIMQIYQMYVKELSVLLTESSNGADPTSESSQQLEVLVKDLVRPRSEDL